MHTTDPEPSFIRRHWLLLSIGTLAAAGLVVWAIDFFASPQQVAPRKQDFSLVQITLPPPPPPPPPPPRQEPQPRPDQTPDNPRDMIAQEPLAADQPESPPEEAPAPAEASMGTNVQSDGPADGFGLVGRGSGGIIGGGTLGGQGRGGNHSPWGWYAAQIRRSVEDAIKKNEKTRTASLRISVKVWPDANGRIERAQLSRSTGDPELDKALTDEILTGIQLRDAPPADMPLPITMRITAQRP